METVEWLSFWSPPASPKALTSSRALVDGGRTEQNRHTDVFKCRKHFLPLCKTTSRRRCVFPISQMTQLRFGEKPPAKVTQLQSIELRFKSYRDGEMVKKAEARGHRGTVNQDSETY